MVSDRKIKNSIVIVVLIVIIAFFAAVFAVLSQPSYSTFNNSYMSFEYPNGWSINQLEGGHVIVAQKDDDYNYSVRLLSGKSKYIDLINNAMSNSKFVGNYVTENSNTTYQVYTIGSKDITFYYFSKNGKYYEIIGTAFSIDEMDHVVETIT